jgi:hypothetical protein
MTDVARRIFLNMAERLEGLESFDYESLVATGLGEALTHDELDALADKPEEIAHLAAHGREQAERIGEAA